MKHTTTIRILGVVGAAILLNGCEVWRQNIKPTACEHPSVGKTDLTGKPASSAHPSSDSLITRADLSSANQEREKFGVVNFTYDSAEIEGKERGKLDAVVKHLKETPADKILIEGHCDERGTAEYNRSLGERRALAARKVLLAQGIDAKRITTISYGKDKPLDTAATEAAHAKNRRDEFVLVHP